MRLNGFAKQSAPQNVHRMLSSRRAHALIANLRDERRTRLGRAFNRRHFRELLHERLLPIDMLPSLERSHHDERMIVVWRANHHGIKLAGVLVKRFAEIAASERSRMLRGHFLQRVRINIAEPCKVHIRMLRQFMSIRRSNAAAHADLQDIELCKLSTKHAARRHGRKRERPLRNE